MTLLSSIKARVEKASKGKWRHDSFPSGTEYIHMRSAPCVTINLEDLHRDSSGSMGAHMTLRNVAAFAGEKAEDLEVEKFANAEFLAHSKEDVEALLEMIERKDDKFRAIIDHQKQIGGTISVYSVTARIAQDGLAIGHAGEGE